MTYLRSPCSNMRPLRNGPPPRRPDPENQDVKSGSKPQPPRPAPGAHPIQKSPRIESSVTIYRKIYRRVYIAILRLGTGRWALGAGRSAQREEAGGGRRSPIFDFRLNLPGGGILKADYTGLEARLASIPRCA